MQSTRMSRRLMFITFFFTITVFNVALYIFPSKLTRQITRFNLFSVPIQQSHITTEHGRYVKESHYSPQTHGAVKITSAAKPPPTPSPPPAPAMPSIPIPSSGLRVPLGTCQVIEPTTGAGFEMAQLGMIVPKDVNSTFRVKFCPSKQTVLRGTFTVERLEDCNLQKPFLYDQTIQEELQKRFGPDELTMELEGREIVWMYQRHVGSCQYKFTYRVDTPGLYRLIAYSYRGNFESLNERQESGYYFPPITYDNLVGEAAWIDLTPAQGDESLQVTPKKLPMCSQLNAPGRWVHTTGINVFKNTSVYHKARPRGTGRPWAVNPREFTWQPYDCTLRHFTAAQASACLTNRTIQLRGDSHTRIFFNHLMKFSCGTTPSDACFKPSRRADARCSLSKVSCLSLAYKNTNICVCMRARLSLVVYVCVLGPRRCMCVMHILSYSAFDGFNQVVEQQHES
jgi:hypothetical protein